MTDDARVVGAKLAQLETWLRYSGQTLEHNMLAAFGPNDHLELSAGLVHGAVIDGGSGVEEGYSIKGPILQAKVLALPAVDGGRPGLAFAGGALFPWGRGDFRDEGWGAFAYAALTQPLHHEGVLIHANLGVTAGNDFDQANVVAGVGTQIRAVAGLHAVGELVFGDPYAPGLEAWSAQVGFRYIFNDNVQCDGTFGSTLGEDDDQQWGTLGLRLVSPELW